MKHCTDLEILIIRRRVTNTELNDIFFFTNTERVTVSINCHGFSHITTFKD